MRVRIDKEAIKLKLIFVAERLGCSMPEAVEFVVNNSCLDALEAQDNDKQEDSFQVGGTYK